MTRTAEQAYRSALELMETRDTPGAIEQLHSCLELDPSHASAWEELGLMLYKAGQNEEAESAFRRALALEPKLWAARTGLANVLSDTFRDELAENEFRRLIAEHQKSVIYAQFADFLLSLDRSDEALEMARMGVSLDPESADAIRMLGKVLSVSDPRKADQAFQRAIALDPSDAYARYTYGFFLAQFEEKLDAARSNLEFAAQHGVLAAAQKLARLGKPPDSDDD